MELKTMLWTKDGCKRVSWRAIVKFMPLALFGLWSLAFTWVLWAEPPTHQTFSSPAQASEALFRAAQAGDVTGLLKIFGPDGKEIVSSGDAVEDKNNREQFVKKYQEMKRLVQEPDGTVRLYVGAENWPLPIPLVSKDHRWYFDTAAAKEEILLRQIGRNEITTMRVLHELVDAEKEYYSQPQDGNVREYAQKLRSDDDKHNGLYWKTRAPEPQSPIGPHLASASFDKDTAGSKTEVKPFYGYYFRILSKQGENAAGGAKNYMVDGKMTGGFAFLAYPAEYSVSGIMTFIVGPDGVVYQKDLGANTAAVAKALDEYNPDKEWERVE